MRMRAGKLKGWSFYQGILVVLAVAFAQPSLALQPMDDDSLAATTGQQGVDISSTYSIGIGLVTSAGATGCTTNCFGGINIVDADGFTLSSQAFTSNLTAGGTAFNLRGFTVAGAAKLSIDDGGNGGTTAAATAVNQATLVFLGATVGGTTTSTLSLTFSSALPTGTYGAGLGVQVADVCSTSVYTSGIGCNTANVAGDYPVLMAPTTGVVMNLQSTGTNTLNFMGGIGSTSANGGQGHMFLLTSTSPDTFTISKTGTCSNQGTTTVSCTTTGVNLALVDPGNFNTASTDIGGAGFGSLAVSGLDFGNTAANNVSIDLCNGTATTDCPANRTNGGAGILTVVNGTALSAVNIVAKGVTIGNVGSGASSANNGLGALAVQNLNLSGVSVLLSGH